VVTIDSDALDAARMLAEHRLPGIVVTDSSGRLRSPLIAVMKDDKFHGVITASRLLAAALRH
jgi:CBS domain-containing protein